MRDTAGSDGVEPAREPASAVRFAGFVLNFEACLLARESGDPIPLTRGEFAVLRTFVTKPGRVISRDAPLDAFTDRRFEPFDRSIDVLVGRLRKKIEPDPKQPRLIVTVPGEGYRFDGLTQSFSPQQEPSIALQPPRGADGRLDRDGDSPAAERPSTFGATGAAKAPMPEQRDATPLFARARLPLAIGLAALLALIGGTRWWFANANRPAAIASQAPAEAARLSIVVLPFANLSGDPAKDYLVDALTDELTTSLARIHGTFVIARNTAFAYKGKALDAKTIGRDLGVRYVLEGSVQFIDTQARVNAQLIDSGTGAHLWAEQFDTARADLLQMQDEIVVRLAREMELTLTTAEAARLKRAPANPDAEDLALQCDAAVQKAGYVGKEGYPLCEQALGIDPNNVRALNVFAIKYYMPVNLGTSADPTADLKRVDELLSQVLALDPTFGGAHNLRAWMLTSEARFDEAIAERERALALNPADAGAMQGMGWDYLLLGQFEKGLEIFDKAIRLSPRDPELHFMYTGKSWAHFGLKHYDQAIDCARRAIAVNTSFQHPHAHLVAALALTGHEAEAREALQNYLALPSSERLRTIAAWKRHYAQSINSNSDPRVLESYDRESEGLRKAGMPEE